MRTILPSCISIALLFHVGGAPTAAEEGKPAPPKGAEVAALEKKLLGAWQGAPCAGDFTFDADGTYVCRNFTPGGNTVGGTWSVRWDALPPTLVLVCKTSDFTTKGGQRAEYEYLGKPLELRLVELDGERWAYRYPSDKHVWRNERPREK